MTKGSHIHHIHTYSTVKYGSWKTVEFNATYFLTYSWYENDVWWRTGTRPNPATTFFLGKYLFICLLYDVITNCTCCSLHLFFLFPEFFGPCIPFCSRFLLVWRLQLTPSLFAQMFATIFFYSVSLISYTTSFRQVSSCLTQMSYI